MKAVFLVFTTSQSVLEVLPGIDSKAGCSLRIVILKIVPNVVHPAVEVDLRVLVCKRAERGSKVSLGQEWCLRATGQLQPGWLWGQYATAWQTKVEGGEVFGCCGQKLQVNAVVESAHVHQHRDTMSTPGLLTEEAWLRPHAVHELLDLA